MRLAITGGTGLVGRFLVEAALAAGDRVGVLGRTPPRADFFSAPVAHLPYALGETPPLDGFDALIHCAFLHAPGRYRGGEGDDPAGFTRANLDGSLRLFEAAKSAGLTRVLFLSSRAVYGAYPPGTPLSEDLAPRPDTLYGDVKWQAEQALAALAAPGFATASLRATGIYGPAGPRRRHKWATLFDAYLSGRPVEPRRATELHGLDLAAAARLLLRNTQTGAFNASDLTLDRHDLLARVAALTGCPHPPPARAGNPVSAMTCTRLARLGWRPGGEDRLAASLPAML
ncbi:NAD(P)-dependent oxidoreductase [Actibacterium sp. MT2.3-13A]|uniref:NAD-dependent epimerase/dehydratase family protein n=1 Tax=Actibacterium sp. MT2.3-13A TaxID=2828332 RepID=UPI001BA6B538|nr:NAD(P)-dependent oxidoreductase [Actibacterium sp. MT2.3-13A]